jgi:lipid-binding SYLF domain-containing protein
MRIPKLSDAMRFAVAGAVVAAGTASPAWAQESNQVRTEIQTVVTQSQAALTTLLNDPELASFKQNIGSAKGILIAPELRKEVKIGKPGGRGILVVRGADGAWHGPAFYNVESVAEGFKPGVSVSGMITLVMTDKAVNALQSGSAKLGGDLTLSAGAVGAGAKSDAATDLIAYTGSKKGGMGDLNADGTTVKVYNDWNAAYYNSQTVSPAAILAGKATSRDAVSLLNTVTKATGGPPPKKKK